MKKLSLFLTVLIYVSIVSADDPIMGIWEGTFLSEDWKNQPITAYIIGIGSDQYRIIFKVGREESPIWSTELSGIERRDVLVAIGEVNLPDKGGNHIVKFEALDSKATGTIVSVSNNPRVQIPFEMRKVYRRSPTLGKEPPPNAIVLFNGSNFDNWNVFPGFISDGTIKIVSKNTFVSKQEFGDSIIHLEFCVPYMPKEPTGAQSRGNSGVYVQGRYEVQVLDSFAEPPADNYCGGIYKVAAPKVNASLPPGEWQTYDITFYAPRFDEAGNKTANARITVYHNGILIHDNLELPHPTPGGVSEKEAQVGPLLLQNHGDEVQYRNIWIAPLE